MAESTGTSLFPDDAKNAARTGILPFQSINAMLREHEIWSKAEILADQIQPASIDLRLGPIAYRIRASFLPGPESTVLDKIQQLTIDRVMFAPVMDLRALNGIGPRVTKDTITDVWMSPFPSYEDITLKSA